MNTKGTSVIITMSAVIFFFAILVLTLVFWTSETSQFDPVRAQISDDVLHQRAQSTLVTLLRTSTPVDINKDGVPDKTTLADAVVLGADVKESVRTRMPGGFTYELLITYPDKTITIASDDMKKTFESYAAKGHALLPGNIDVTLYLADQSLKEKNGDVS